METLVGGVFPKISESFSLPLILVEATHKDAIARAKLPAR
jgi:hypothetical protein